MNQGDSAEADLEKKVLGEYEGLDVSCSKEPEKTVGNDGDPVVFDEGERWVWRHFQDGRWTDGEDRTQTRGW